MVVDDGAAIGRIVIWSVRAGSVSSVPVIVLLTGEDIDDVTLGGGKSVSSVPVRVFTTGEDIDDVVLNPTKTVAEGSRVLVGLKVVDGDEIVELLKFENTGFVGVTVTDDGLSVELVAERILLENAGVPEVSCEGVTISDDGVSVELEGERVVVRTE